MATRQTTLITKNSNIVNRPLSAITSLFGGEAVVNTADGIMYFSGVTSSTNEWTPAGPNPTFFEVGSNLYDLKLRNRITKYEGASGSGLIGKFLSGTTNGFVLADISAIAGVDTYTTGFSYNNNVFTIKQNNGQSDLNALLDSMTGLTVTGGFNVSGNTTLADLYLSGHIMSYSGVSNLTGKFLSGTSSNGFVLGNISDITGVDTYTTGFSYNDSNVLTIKQNNSQPDLSILIGQMSGLTIGATPGSGDLVVNGNLTVLGQAISAFTGELYIEDNNIYLNYNPTGSTAPYSIGAGWSIQDGSGIQGSDVNLNINRMDTFTGLTANNVPNVSEYVSSTGYANRGFITQLHDIVIRSTNVSTPNGVRVLAEFDTLDGGTY